MSEPVAEEKRNWWRYPASGCLLGGINVVALAVGRSWDVWTHQQHPFAAQIPVAGLCSIVLFLLCYGILRIRPAEMLSFSVWKQVYLTSLPVGALLFLTAALLVPGVAFSAGRLVVLILFQALVNPVVLAVAAGVAAVVPGGVWPALKRRRWFVRGMLLGAGLLFSGVLLLMMEGVFYLLNQSRPPGVSKKYEGGYLGGGFFVYDGVLGTKLAPNKQVVSRLTIDDRLCWDVEYGTDEYGRRRAGQAGPADGAASKTAVFFGCSFLFGEGCADSETMPAVFSARSPGYRAVNYAVPGYGPQQMLALLQSGRLSSEAGPGTTLGVYVYLEDVHESRAIGDMAMFNSWGAEWPCYVATDDGGIERTGSFLTAHPARARCYRVLGKSQAARYLKINFPKRLEEDHYELTARIVKASRDEFTRQFPGSGFVVVIYPKKEAHGKLLPWLEKAGIPLLNYSALFDPGAPEFSFQGDGHPTPRAQQILADRLAADLGKSGK